MIHENYFQRNVNVKWPDSIMRQVGKLLYSIILADIQVDSNMFRGDSTRQDIPAFYSVNVQKPGEPYSKEEIRVCTLIIIKICYYITFDQISLTQRYYVFMNESIIENLFLIREICPV